MNPTQLDSLMQAVPGRILQAVPDPPSPLVPGCMNPTQLDSLMQG